MQRNLRKFLIAFLAGWYVVSFPLAILANVSADAQLWSQMYDYSDGSADDSALQIHTRRAKHFLSRKFNLKGVTGFRPGDTDGVGTGHGDGLAIDFMTNEAGVAASGESLKFGNDLANFLIANRDVLQVSYIIWQQKFWAAEDNIYGKGMEWGPMPDRGSVTQNHYDHVHVSFRIGGGNSQSKDSKFSEGGAGDYVGVHDEHDHNHEGEEFELEYVDLAHSPLVKEDELKGMSPQQQLFYKQVGLIAPEKSNLTSTETVAISTMAAAAEMERRSYLEWIRISIRVGAIMLLIYSLLFLISYIIDLNNTLFDFSLIGLITFGIYSSVMGYDGKGKLLDTRQALVYTLVMMGFGAFLLTDWFFKLIAFFLSLLGR